jgi:hypothetical protein
VKQGSWWTLVDIIKEAEQLKLDHDTRAPVYCPNDSTLLVTSSTGQVRCPWDGWSPGDGGDQ